jgi:hypothetical protein
VEDTSSCSVQMMPVIVLMCCAFCMIVWI